MSPSGGPSQISDDLEEYQRLLRDKEIKLTDIRLEALATAHQLDQSKEDNLKMRIEIEQLKSDNLRMQQMIVALQQHQHQQQQMNPNTTSPSSSVISSSSAASSGHDACKHGAGADPITAARPSSASSSSSSVSILKSPSHHSTAMDAQYSAPSAAAKRVVVSIYVGDLSDPLGDILNETEPFFNQTLIGM